MRFFVKIFQFFFNYFDLKVIKLKDYKKLYLMSRSADDLDILRNIPPQDQCFFIECLNVSKSQLRQDIMALIYNQRKLGGFFVEFGAFDGITLSNTWLLEKSFGWHGILAEPTISLQNEIKNSRSAILETACVWSNSDETVDFSESTLGELSTISSYTQTDNHSNSRVEKNNYKVKTISLLDMLKNNNAPLHIDFLSVDTEGSEYEILSNFDFLTYSFGFIAVEHNYGENEIKLDNLLIKNGYTRILKSSSKFDAWYVPTASIIQKET